MKRAKTISIDEYLIQEINRQHPKARRNFSLVVCSLLRAILNNPIKYWRAQAKYHNARMMMALKHVETLELTEKKKEQPQILIN